MDSYWCDRPQKAWPVRLQSEDLNFIQSRVLNAAEDWQQFVFEKKNKKQNVRSALALSQFISKDMRGVLWRSALVLITSWLPLKGAYTGKHRAYSFQLDQLHCGICRSINQGRSGDGRQLCLFTSPKTTSAYSH